ncbi:MAG: hypothetical protein LR015_12895 [Verrucomicrobia bacterium]|nr:hypothetical protein [Verrucomicrobiota bacterium]
MKRSRQGLLLQCSLSLDALPCPLDLDLFRATANRHLMALNLSPVQSISASATLQQTPATTLAALSQAFAHEDWILRRRLRV